MGSDRLRMALALFALFLAWMAAVAHADAPPRGRAPLLDVEAAITCRAAHAAGEAVTAGCPRHVRRRPDRIDLLTPLVFEYDKATLRPQSLAVIRELAALLVAHAELTRIEIQGHNGFDESMRGARLSDRRARAVRDALVAHGVAPDRLTARGYGDTRPLVMPRTDADRRRNTRIELHLLPPPPPPPGSVTSRPRHLPPPG